MTAGLYPDPSADASASLSPRRAAPTRPLVVIGVLVVVLLVGLASLSIAGASHSWTPDPARRPLAPPLAGPRLSASGPSGGEVSLAEFRGQPVVVNFWASWCPPCRAEARDLERVSQAYRDRGVVFLGIDIQDTEDEARRFLREYDVTYPNLLDVTNALAVGYGVNGIPSTYFVDRDGRVAGSRTGPLDARQLVAQVEELLR